MDTFGKVNSRLGSGPSNHQWRVFTWCLLPLSLFGVLAFPGCGSTEQTFNKAADSLENGAPAAPGSADQESAKVAANARAGDSDASPASATAQLIEAASTVPRKIIYNATVALVSDNFATAQNNLMALIKTHKGYVAETNVNGTPGTPRQGSWKIRIPESQFNGFMAAVVKLGELQTTHTDSQDVTAEFYDLQARIANKQVEEKRLIMHLQRSTAKLSDILAVEKELSRVRGEIEQMQGRLRLLANMTSLTTITVTLQEVKEYVAPRPATFGEQIARTFQYSFGQLGDFAKGAVLAFVALLPWAVTFLLVGIPIWRIARRQQKAPRS